MAVMQAARHGTPDENGCRACSRAWGYLRCLTGRVDLLQTGTRDSVERIGVLGEPFGFVTRVREDETVFHGDVRVDLRQAGDDVFRRLAGDLTPYPLALAV